MTTNKTNRKAFDSYFKKIEEHFVKIKESQGLGYTTRVEYYVKEIQRNFIGNIDRLLEKTNMTYEQEQKYLLLKKRFDEITNNLSLN